MSDAVSKATLEFAADGSSVKSEVREIGQEVTGLAATAAAASVKASGSLAGIGKTADGAAQKLTAAQQRVQQSLERTAATFGKSRAEVAEYRAIAAGLPREVYAPLVATIRETEAAMGGMSTAQRTAAAAGAQLAESEASAAARLKTVASAAIERAEALQRQVEGARAAAVAERELASVSGGGVRPQYQPTVASQNRGFQELTRDINEVNAALAAIERGAGSQSAIEAQTQKLVSLWGQGRITAEQYSAAVKSLDASEAALARSSAQAAAQGDRFIAGLREQAETAGMTTRQLLEYRAAQLGVGDRAAPLIARLAQVNKGLDGTGVSARQTAAALRMVPAQMTDIVTQLAGGQSPFLILIQQGGQLKDSFGGIGPMFRALLGMVSPFAIAVGGVAAAVAALGYAAYKGSSEARDFANSLALTGDFAGKTSGQLIDMSRRVGEAHSTLGRSADVVNKLVSSGRVTGAALEMVAGAIVNMSETGAKSVDDLVSEFARLGESPSQAIAKINESMHFLDSATYERIRALEQQGQKEQAVALAQATLADATNRAADRVRASAGSLERGWNSLGLAARRAWDSMLNIGRPTPIGELRKQAEQLAKNIESLENNQGFSTNNGGAAIGSGRNRAQQALKRAKGEHAVIVAEIERQEKEEAAARGEALKGQATQEKIAATTRLSEMMKATRDRAQIRADEIKSMREDAARAGWTAQQIAEAEKRINEKYKDPKGAGGANRDDAATRRLAALREQEASLTAQLIGEKKLTDAGRARAEFEQQIADLKSKAILTADQKSLLANEDAIRAQLAKNEGIAKELATKQAMLKLDERAAQIQQAMASSAESRQDQYDRQLGTAGLGQVARQRAEAENSIRQEFRRYQEQLAKATPQDQLGSDRFREEQAKISEGLQAALGEQRAYYQQVDKLNSDWSIGAREAFSDYAESAANVSQQAQGLFSGAFRGMEDALTRFVSTGKLSFKDLANSIIADLARIAARQAIVGAIGSIATAFAGGASAGIGSATASDVANATARSGGGMMFLSSGGYTGDGAKYEPAGIVHKGEYVLNAAATARIGVDKLDSLNKMGYAQGGLVGRPPGTWSGAGPGGGPAYQITNQVIFNDTGRETRQTGQDEAVGREMLTQMEAVAQRVVDRSYRQGGTAWNARNGRA
ncbi:phage tail tape measure protein [Achromobacter spanius]|uniref:Phage tail tape measure protein n=1 Tax=Achromobacter spanius TaxID=217203 RepID=A0AA42LVJ3_9BURK|nr:phage tail tape measure protein [Achromobacter spanius]MDH0740224.1 phage tail tape measure protein [Achromobacter spanius]